VDQGGIGAMRQLATLNRIARIAIQDLALQPMLQRIVDILHDEFDWDFIACASVDVGNQRFRCEAVRSSVPTEIVVGYERELGSGVVGTCAQRGETIDVEDTLAFPGFVDTLGGTRSELCVPVIHDGEVLAVLNAESREPRAFHGQRALLETVADQIAGMIRVAKLLDHLQRTNAQLRDAYARVEELSRTDELTGVANRRSFDRWIEQAMVERNALALLMIDVDHFKAYNDGYGHVAGDACLQQVAALLAYLLAGTSARLARYGGEEFAVLLPGSDAPAAAAIGERLRAAIEARAFDHGHAEGGLVTISVGVAARRAGAGGSAEELVAEADLALYAAKHAGRNRVRLADIEAGSMPRRGLVAPSLGGAGAGTRVPGARDADEIRNSA
jgi:diguanylate cyclase (GGDEF)-like protein